MDLKNILFNIELGIGTITINRPNKLNALNRETILEIGRLFKTLESDNNVKAVILTGAGQKAFIAGADISEFNNLGIEEGKELSREGHDVFDYIESFPKPVIAAINGFVLGGGCELAMACHLRVASQNAMFGQPEVKLGLIPGYGGTQRLPQLIGKTKALELLLTADMIKADEALTLGLVNYVTAPETLIEKCLEIAGKITRQAPLAVAAIIQSVNANYNKEVNGFEKEIEEFGKCFVTKDFVEGATAFVEKRKQILLVNDIVAYTVVVSGKVQGVFFRKHTKLKADELSIKGTVRNLPDGSVYLEIEGSKQTVSKMLNWCKKGSPDAVVTNVSSSLTVEQHFKEFKVEY